MINVRPGRNPSRKYRYIGLPGAGGRFSKRSQHYNRQKVPKRKKKIEPFRENGNALRYLPFSSFWRQLTQVHSTEIIRYQRILCGRPSLALPTYYLSRWLFLHLLGLIYLIAFISLWVQIDGLIGDRGIFPVNQYLDAIWENFGIIGYWTFPTLCWVSADTQFLHLLCASGVFFSVLVIFGIFPVPSLIGLWACYLSFSTVCRTFLGYQWDTLLLEVGFLAIFFAPLQFLPKLSREKAPSKIIICLFYWLLFRLMFSSGVVKLISGDLSWRTLTALSYHYQTQPIPNVTAWYAHQLVEWFQKFSVFGTLSIELILPFFMLAPRRLRLLAFFGTVSLQILILITGNYCFFNLLTVALCILLLDDGYLTRVFPRQLFTIPNLSQPRSLTAFGISLSVAIVVIPLSIVQMKARVFKIELSNFEQRVHRWTAPYRSVNSYGLFATMTKSRPEIIVEGSIDGKEWKSYEFKWKPGNLGRSPPQVAPHQPRIDWQMWFEALNYLRGQKPTSWFRSFLLRLLEGEDRVLRLLAYNPFVDSPPRYIRAVVYDYKFTNKETKQESGNWWSRRYLGIYVPPSGLDHR